MSEGMAVSLRNALDTISDLRQQLAQAQASLAAARAEALEEAAVVCREPKKFSGCVSQTRRDSWEECAIAIRDHITPSGSTALAKLLAEERLRMLDKFDSLLSQIKTECLQSSRGTQLGEGVEIGRKDVKDWLAARVAELKGGSKSDDTRRSSQAEPARIRELGLGKELRRERRLDC